MEFLVVIVGIIGFIVYAWGAVQLLLAEAAWCNLIGGFMLMIYLGAIGVFGYLVASGKERFKQRRKEDGVFWMLSDLLVACKVRQK